MVQNDQRGTQRRVVARLLFICLLAIALVPLVRGCIGPYWQARRLVQKDPWRAAGFFAADIRDDWTGSFRSVEGLASIGQSCALLEMIGLMDLPDGRYGADLRRSIWKEVSRRTIAAPNCPGYDPAASQDSRAAQKKLWLQWYDDSLKPANVPRTDVYWPFTKRVPPSSRILDSAPDSRADHNRTVRNTPSE
jgi:hypothetical protein